MKKVFGFLMMLGASMFLVNCGGGSTPEDAALSFMTALSSGDIEKAKEFGTTETNEMLDMLAMMGGEQLEQMASEDVSFTVSGSEVSEDGNSATVTLNDGTEDQDIPLKKVDDEWKVSMSKEDMGKEDPMSGMEDDLEDLEMEMEEVTEEMETELEETVEHAEEHTEEHAH